jgi:hypothetical protein
MPPWDKEKNHTAEKLKKEQGLWPEREMNSDQ